MSANPTRCQHCGQPFPILASKQPIAWRTSDGRFYCNEYCAEAAEEAHVPRRRLAS